jgi:hypothetical protein
MNLYTKGISYSRDAIWVNKMYGDYFGTDKGEVLPTTNTFFTLIIDIKNLHSL